MILDGQDVTDVPPEGRAARGMARTFQHPELFGDLTAREHLVLADRVRYAKRRVWSDMFNMAGFRGCGPDERSRLDALIELLGLDPIADRRSTGLPLGWARMVELGRALAAAPTVLLLDEPSSGLDSLETRRFESTLRTVANERDLSVLMVEHDVELVLHLCNLVYVLDSGRLIASGRSEEIRSNPAVRAAYLGEGDSPGGAVP